jgi:molecular chaperone GrpE
MADRRHREDPQSTGPKDRRFHYRVRRRRYAEMAAAREAAAGPEGCGHQSTLMECEERIAKLSQDNTGLRDLALRTRADLENARKRFQREKADTVKFATETLVRELVHVIDNLERAILSAGNSIEAVAIRDGVQMVLDHFLGILTNNGLELITPTDETFDPNFHEAVATVERDDVPEGLITDVFQKGYVLRGRVVRPAMVRVARAPRCEEPATPVADPDSQDTLADLEETGPSGGQAGGRRSGGEAKESESPTSEREREESKGSPVDELIEEIEDQERVKASPEYPRDQDAGPSRAGLFNEDVTALGENPDDPPDEEREPADRS